MSKFLVLCLLLCSQFAFSQDAENKVYGIGSAGVSVEFCLMPQRDGAWVCEPLYTLEYPVGTVDENGNLIAPTVEPRKVYNCGPNYRGAQSRSTEVHPSLAACKDAQKKKNPSNGEITDDLEGCEGRYLHLCRMNYLKRFLNEGKSILEASKLASERTIDECPKIKKSMEKKCAEEKKEEAQKCHNDHLIECRRNYTKRFVSEGHTEQQAIVKAKGMKMVNCPKINKRRKEKCGEGEPQIGYFVGAEGCEDKAQQVCRNSYIDRFLMQGMTEKAAKKMAGMQTLLNCPKMKEKADKDCAEPTDELAKGACKWKEGYFPRKVTGQKACGKYGSATLCVGYVVCNTEDGEMERLATCGPENCDLGKATECALQGGYYSKAVTEEDKWWKKVQKASIGPAQEL